MVTITSVFPDGEAGGSGFVVSNDGLILTNAHVVTNSADQNVQASDVKPADHVFVRFQNGDQVAASIVGYDLFADVAVLRVHDADGEKLQPVPLGNSSRVRVGEPVAAIGSPFLEAGSLSVGVVSAINRSLSSGTGFAIPGAIQTDAAINHGNSGGPLFNAGRRGDRHQRADPVHQRRRRGRRFRRADRPGPALDEAAGRDTARSPTAGWACG